MTRLAKIRDTQKSIQENLKTIQYSLDDDDISVRRRALDLLYGIANEENAKEIVDILLECLKTCGNLVTVSGFEYYLMLRTCHEE